MKIVYIASAIVPSRDANSIQVMQMVHAMIEEGHEVALILPLWKPGAEPDVTNVQQFYGLQLPLRIIRIPWIPFPGRGTVFGLLAALRALALRPDAVYTRYPRAGYFSTRVGLRVVFECHAPQNDWSFQRMLASPNLLYIVAISMAMRDFLIKSMERKSVSVIVAHDGAVSPEPTHEPAARSTDGDVFQVGYAGHLYEGKGMEVIGQLAQLAKSMHIHVIGGKLRDIERWRQLLRGSDNLTFHGFVPTARVPRLLRTMDVLLAPYQRRVASAMGEDISQWMSPLKIFEYMASGVPIVASDLPVLREVLEDERNSLLCPPSDPAAWIAAIERLRDDPDLAKNIAFNAAEDIRARYTWRKRAQIVLSLLDRSSNAETDFP